MFLFLFLTFLSPSHPPLLNTFSLFISQSFFLPQIFIIPHFISLLHFSHRSGVPSDPSGDRYTPGMVVDLHEGSPDLIDMRTKPAPISAWMKKQGEDLFKAWKKRCVCVCVCVCVRKKWRREMKWGMINI